MTKLKSCVAFICAVCTACSSPMSERVSGGLAEADSKYLADWESLEAHDKEPDWFKDAKLGIYFHWGVYSVPAFDNEWYPRWMYFPNLGDNWGGKVYPHHVENHGPLTEFNYHDFIPLFKAEKFDAKAWAELFKEAGATFAGQVAQHHDGFAMWGSDVNPWNVRDMGPKKDIAELLFKELKEHDLKTIATFHHARSLQRYADKPKDWAGAGRHDAGWDSHFPYHPDLITSTTDPKLRKLYGNIPEPEFHDYWYAQVEEVVNKYSPDIIWFDSWLDKIPEDYRKKVVAHQFNHGYINNQQTLVAYKQEDLPANIGVLDIEQGGKTDISEDYWLTDVTISHGSWCYTDGMGYKDPALMIRNMIDVWSKKGVVLLNVSPRADGVIPKEQRQILASIGAWIKAHKEAVYETRAYSMYGYGVAEFEQGHFGGQSATIEYSKNDVRFSVSKDGKSLFVYILGLPDANSTLSLNHVFEKYDVDQIKQVSVVGSGKTLDWVAEGQELRIVTPRASQMNDIATVFKVEFQ